MVTRKNLDEIVGLLVFLPFTLAKKKVGKVSKVISFIYLKLQTFNTLSFHIYIYIYMIFLDISSFSGLTDSSKKCLRYQTLKF